MLGLWHILHKAVEEEGLAILVTLLHVEGSSPREAGARMIVTASGLRGTIGGGALEHAAFQDALGRLKKQDEAAQIVTHALGPDLGQCCGGRVQLALETFSSIDLPELARWARTESEGVMLHAEFGDAPHAVRTVLDERPVHAQISRLSPRVWLEHFDDKRMPVHLFGAGHVGKALVMALAPLPFRVTWYDPRDNIFPSLVPAHTQAVMLGDPNILTFSSADCVLVMTHSHPLDLAIVTAALRSPARFIGLIGSDTKKARFHSRLRAAEFSREAIERIVCPIGIEGISGKEPAMIAASITAQLLILSERKQALAHPRHLRVAMGFDA